MSVRPGLGAAAADRSSDVSSDETRELYVASSGRGSPAGGIMRPRSFRTTFSRASAFPATRCRSIVSSASPAVRTLPLWHATQYWSMTVRCGERDGGGEPAGCCCAPPAMRPADANNTAKPPVKHTSQRRVIRASSACDTVGPASRALGTALCCRTGTPDSNTRTRRAFRITCACPGDQAVPRGCAGGEQRVCAYVSDEKSGPGRHPGA